MERYSDRHSSITLYLARHVCDWRSVPLLCRLLHHECKYSGKDRELNKITTRCVQDTRPWYCCRKRGSVLKEWEEKRKKLKWRKKRTKTTEKLTFSSLQQDKSPTWVCLHKIGGGLDGRGTEKNAHPRPEWRHEEWMRV